MKTFLSKYYGFLLLTLSHPINAKSIDSMAKTAHRELNKISIALFTVGFVMVGFSYLKGEQEGREKMSATTKGGFIAMGAAPIVALIQRITGS